jgi:hypothetical protein
MLPPSQSSLNPGVASTVGMVIGVWIYPGLTVLTLIVGWMPSLPHSAARLRAIWSTAALLELYATVSTPLLATVPLIEAMRTMLPGVCCSCMIRAIACAQRKVPVTLTSRIRLNASCEYEIACSFPEIPAQVTRPRIGCGETRVACSMAAVTLAGEITSQETYSSTRPREAASLRRPSAVILVSLYRCTYRRRERTPGINRWL